MQSQPQPRYAAPKPSRYPSNHFFGDDSDEEEEEEDMEEEEIAPRQRNTPVNRKPQLPELEVEEHPGKGWLATARLGAGLTSNNIKLELEDDDTLIIVAQGVNRGRLVKQPLAFLNLPEGVDIDNIQAFVKNGALNVLMPAKTQVIPVRKKKAVNRTPTAHTPASTKPTTQHHSQSRTPTAQQTQPASVFARSTPSGKTTKVPIIDEMPQATPKKQVTPPSHSSTTAPSPLTARKLQLANEEEDVFERALKYAIPD